MKVFKWSFVVAVTFAVTWMLIFTFTQDPFKESAPMKIFWYTTPGVYPMYAYAAAAFGVGLFIGFIVAAYYYILGRAGIRSNKKLIKELEERAETAAFAYEQIRGERDRFREELESLRAGAAKPQGKPTRTIKTDKSTKSQKAVGERDILS